jgi:hypothetical protein
MQDNMKTPSAIQNEPEALELLRVWVSRGERYISMGTNVWKDPAVWGIMLVDLAKHIASEYHTATGMDPIIALHRVREGFDAEWRQATDIQTLDADSHH